MASVIQCRESWRFGLKPKSRINKQGGIHHKPNHRDAENPTAKKTHEFASPRTNPEMRPPSPPRCPWRARSGPDRFPVAAARDSGVIHELFVSSGLPATAVVVPETHPGRAHGVHGGNLEHPSTQRNPHCPSQRSIKPPSGLDGRSDQWVHASRDRRQAGRRDGPPPRRFPPFYGRLLFVAWTTTTTTTAGKAKQRTKKSVAGVSPPFLLRHDRTDGRGRAASQTRGAAKSTVCGVPMPAHAQDLCDGAVKGHGERRGEARGEARPRCERWPRSG